MAKQKYHSGIAHVIIIVVLAIALVGSVGYIVWQNLSNNRNTSNTGPNNDSDADTTPAVTYKTYTSDRNNISFKYPDAWNITETKGGNDEFYARYVAIKDENNSLIANLDIGTQLGGTCDVPSNYKVIAAEPTTLAIKKYDNSGATYDSVASYSVAGVINSDGSYDVHYGLTDSFGTTGDIGEVCSNAFYFTFSPKIDSITGMGFANMASTKHFESLTALQEYLDTNEYKAIKKMILSLTY